MPRVQWPLRQDRPIVEVVLALAQGGQQITRSLLADTVSAVGVPSPPAGFDGIGCFRFLNRFTYGNFADHGQFGLET
ncbi:MAG: hypothetical protein ACREHD_12965 [Pirellulales bacterium]